MLSLQIGSVALIIICFAALILRCQATMDFLQLMLVHIAPWVGINTQIFGYTGHTTLVKIPVSCALNIINVLSWNYALIDITSYRIAAISD